MPDEFEEQSAARPFWSGTITFGLVSIPVALFAANRRSGVTLHMIGPDGHRLRRKYFSQKTGRELAADEIVRGYEIKKGDYIVMTDEELDRLAPEMSRDIDLRRFVPYDDIPKLYFEHGYFLAPAGASGRAYKLLAETMEKTGQAGIATFVMRGKQYLVAMIADNGLLRAETLRFFGEVRQPGDVGLPPVKRPAASAVRDFEKAIVAKSSDELPRDQMHNREAERLAQVVERKRLAHRDVVGSPQPEEAGGEPPRARPVDLFEALQRALSNPAMAKNGNTTAPARNDDLSKVSKQELYKRATRMRIGGRSKMTREQLIEAIQHANA